MNKYIKPIVFVEEVAVENIIAASGDKYGFSDTKVSGGLSNGRRRNWDNGWD